MNFKHEYVGTNILAAELKCILPIPKSAKGHEPELVPDIFRPHNLPSKF